MSPDDADLCLSYVALSSAIRDELTRSTNEVPPTPAVATGGIHTCIRVRPPLACETARFGSRIPGMGAASFAQFEYESCLVDVSRQEVAVLSEERKIGKPTGRLSTQRFSADWVFGGANEEVFEAAVLPLVRHARRGGSAAFIAFGQTGAGKTHTCMHIQRAAAAALLADPQVIAIRISILEIFGERLDDLLRGGGDDANADVVLRESGAGELVVAGLREVTCATKEEAEALLAAANAVRATSPTAANERSSRSHALCTLWPVFAPDSGARGSTMGKVAACGDAAAVDISEPSAVGGISELVGGRLVLVDLAGSERREDVGTHDKARMAETRATNASLSALKDCVRLKRQQNTRGGGRPGVVPFRRSSLTRLLKPFLEADGGGGGRGAGASSAAASATMCCVMAHLSPVRSAGKHTASTLEFVGSLCGATRDATERANFNRVEAWSAVEVQAWLKQLDGGGYAHLSCCFGGYTGKMLSIEWLGHVIKRVRAEGGEQADAERIYNAFHDELSRAKWEQQHATQPADAKSGRRPSRPKAAVAASAGDGPTFEIFEGPRRTGAAAPAKASAADDKAATAEGKASAADDKASPAPATPAKASTAGDKADAAASGDEWRDQARRCVLSGRAFTQVSTELTFLAVEEFAHEVDLMPLASLAECGHTECFCTRSTYPWVRRRFREEVVSRAVEARARREQPFANGRLTYVGLGSGLLLGDLDVLMGLQAAGFVIEHATFVDTDYDRNCHDALAQMASYLSPGQVLAFSSHAAYVDARLRAAIPAAQLLVQMDVTEVELGDSLLLSVLAMGDEGGGIGFRLANRHHPKLIPMISWRRKPTPGAMKGQSAPSLIAALHARLDVHAEPEAAYARVATMLDVSTLVEMEVDRQVPVASAACEACDDEERLSSHLQRM